MTVGSASKVPSILSLIHICVESAEVSYEAGTAVVTLSSDVADDVLKKAVEDQDYTCLLYTSGKKDEKSGINYK